MSTPLMDTLAVIALAVLGLWLVGRVPRLTPEEQRRLRQAEARRAAERTIAHMERRRMEQIRHAYRDN